MYYPVVQSIPLTVLTDAVRQLEQINDYGMLADNLRLTGYQYDENAEMWILYFGGISLNVHLPYSG